MRTHHEVEGEVLATIQVFMRFWEQRGVEAIDGFFAYVAEDFRGFGTGQSEYYPDRDTFRAHTEHEHQHTSYSVTFAAPWMKVRVLHPRLALAEGEFKVDVHTEAGMHVLRLRCSFLFERRDGRWVLLHFHFSVPNALQREGDSLLELFKARNQELEREVVRRTAELEQSLADLKAAQARLVHQEKMASLGALTAGIAHEIKNPLNFVNNFAQLSVDLAHDLQAGLAGGEDVADLLEDLKRNAAAIHHHGQRADAIVRGMMQHASGGSGKRESTDLNALLDEYVELAYHGMRAQGPCREMEIVRAYDETIGQVELVPRDLGRVFLNLLSNAFDAVQGREGAAIAVRTRKVDGKAEVRVCDNGPGIRAEIRDRIFEPFFTTKPPGRGTGLGLSLAYDIVTQGHGGMLVVESSEGEGATFVVTLPT